MAAIVNERDVKLQATDPRFIAPPLPPDVQETVDAVKGVSLTATSTQFRVPQSGSPAPSSITLTARLTIVSGTITWTVVAGSATLTGSGNTRTLTAANMATDAVRIRASVVYEGGTYYSEVTIIKTYDGAKGEDGSPGSDGADGVRGTVTLSRTITGTAWSDSAANSAITTNTGSSLRVVGDVVTLINNNAAYAQTRRWNGAAWVIVNHMFSGDVIVEKTLSADKVKGGEFTGETFTGGLFDGARIRGSQEISVVDGGDFTIRQPGGGVKIGYAGDVGVWYFNAAVYVQAQMEFASSAGLLIHCGIEGTTGSKIMMTGRTFWVDLGDGPIQMYVGDPA